MVTHDLTFQSSKQTLSFSEQLTTTDCLTRRDSVEFWQGRQSLPAEEVCNRDKPARPFLSVDKLADAFERLEKRVPARSALASLKPVAFRTDYSTPALQNPRKSALASLPPMRVASPQN